MVMDRCEYRRLWSLICLSLFCLTLFIFSAVFPSLRPWSPATTLCEWIQPLHPAKRATIRLRNARNVVVFTDGTNFDDVVALLFLAKSKLCNLVAIYITGNGWASPGASIRHFFNILTMMGSQYASIPIFVGSYYALMDQINSTANDMHMKQSYRSYIPFGPGGILYSDVMFGMAHFLPQGKNAYDIRKTPDTDHASISALFRLLKSTKAAGKVTFLSIGTLTPFALMFSKRHIREVRPLLRRVDGLYIMGGAVDVNGNIFSSPTNKKAEFNVFADPDGAEIALMDISKLVDITLVPLDAIQDVSLTESLLFTLLTEPQTPEAQLVGHMMNNLRDTWFAPDMFFQTAFLWDPTAAMTMLYPNVITEKRKRMVRVVVEEGVDGPHQGWTKPCTPAEILYETCADIEVIDGLNGELVRHILVETLQQKENSAERPLVCLD